MDKRAEPSLHHIGMVVASIENAAKRMEGTLSAAWNGDIFHDPLQEVRVTFLRGARPGEALIELVEPAAPGSTVHDFLNRGGGLHHLCYEVDDLDAHLREMHAHGHTIVRPPLPAVAFGNRRIGWVLTRPRLLLEFLAREKPETSRWQR